MTNGARTIPAIGAISRMKSKLRLSMVAFIAFAAVANSSV
jgi:hypothetical protein